MSTRNLIALLFILVSASPALVKIGLVSHYYLKLEEYKQTCINKNKPALKCNGNCRLAKELKQADNNDPQNSRPDFPANMFNESTVYLLEIQRFKFEETGNSGSFYENMKSDLPHNLTEGFFHPPEFLS